MRELYERAEAAGASRSPVLIVGETGTGKEPLARAIHESSEDPSTPFVAVNCGALPRELVESELFGYVRGAFSGAHADKCGLFQAANGGALFLDEITEMSSEMQSKLLRAIQEGAIRPVGGTREHPVRVRVIASTNCDLDWAVRRGRLRKDLYFRLQVCVLTVPPLRERIEDVPVLVEHFIHLFNEQCKREVPVEAVEDEAIGAMESYSWPGNVRELRNTIEGAFVFGTSRFIGIGDLPPAMVAGGIPASTEGCSTALRAGSPRIRELPHNLQEIERRAVVSALQRTLGNKARAAEILGISRKTLYKRLKDQFRQ